MNKEMKKNIFITLLLIPWVVVLFVIAIFKPRIESTYSIPEYRDYPICSTVAVLDVRVPNWIPRHLIYKISFFTGGVKLEDGWHLHGNISRTGWSDDDLCN